MELQTNVKTGDLKITEGSAATVVSPQQQVIGEKKEIVTEQKPQEQDLIKRAAQVKIEEKPAVPENPFGLTEDDFKKVQEDPVLSKHYKSMQADYTRKTQSIAEEKKQMAELRKSLEQSNQWTPERIDQLLKDPTFVNAAQTLAQKQNPAGSGLTDQQWSNLTDAEKMQIQGLQSEVAQLKQQNFVQQMRQQDTQLKEKYPNYDSQGIDIITADILANKRIITREDIWRAVDYEPMAKRVYQLGREDALKEQTEKIQAVSPDGLAVNAQREVPAAEKGESNLSFFRRIALNNLARASGQK